MTHSSESIDPSTWRGLRQLWRTDFLRLKVHLRGSGIFSSVYQFLLPNMQALFWYRFNRFLLLNGWKRLSSFLCLISIYIHRIELPPTSSIGPECLITHCGGSFYGVAGARLTIMGTCGAGPWGNKKDVGGGVGYPVLGDDVVLGQLSAVIGPVRIGNGTHIGPGCVVMHDVEPGAILMVRRPREFYLGRQKRVPENDAPAEEL